MIFCEHNSLVLLTHFNEMITFLSCLPKIVKPILKRFVVLWSTKTNSSFVEKTSKCFLNLSLCDEESYLEMILQVIILKYLSENILML